MPINPKKIFILWPKKIHTRNLMTKKNSCGSKIPHPPPPPPITFLMVRPLRTGKESWLKFNDDEVERHFKEMHFESYDARVWLDDAFLSEMHLTTCQTRTTCATWRDPSLYSWAKWLWWDALSPLCSTRLTWRGSFLLNYSFKALKRSTQYRRERTHLHRFLYQPCPNPSGRSRVGTRGSPPPYF